jgi:hypothetical protein
MEEILMRPPILQRQGGWGTSEYLAVLLGLMTVWSGTQVLLAMARQHHDEFSWALTMPF